PLDDRQWGDASVDLRLGLRFTPFKKSEMLIPLPQRVAKLLESLWHEHTYPTKDQFGKRVGHIIDPDEFILAQTYERIWIPLNLISRVEGRSTYARFGLSMHETAPWLQPGWDGHITLEIRNNGQN